MLQPFWNILSKRTLPATDGYDPAAEPWQMEQAVWHAVY